MAGKRKIVQSWLEILESWLKSWLGNSYSWPLVRFVSGSKRKLASITQLIKGSYDYLSFVKRTIE